MIHRTDDAHIAFITVSLQISGFLELVLETKGGCLPELSEIGLFFITLFKNNQCDGWQEQWFLLIVRQQLVFSGICLNVSNSFHRQVNFLSCQFFALAAAFWFRLYLSPSHATPLVRHAVATLLGITFLIFCFGW